ncbi:MAG: GNAT family N-acetyltransferase, partial [Bacilli bacterium]|nr:GNAT family N-acetyltransferase [Bacilli bacterium]
NEEIVGFAYINIHQDIFEKCKPYMSIWSVRVKETSRRKGIGTKLFKYIEDLARKIDCSFICLIAEEDNVVANEFYNSLDYSKQNGYVKFIGR